MGIWYHLVLVLSLALHNLLFPLPPAPPPSLLFSASWLLTHPPPALHPAPTLPRGGFGAFSRREEPIQQWGLAIRPGRLGKVHSGCTVGRATIAPADHSQPHPVFAVAEARGRGNGYHQQRAKLRGQQPSSLHNRRLCSPCWNNGLV